MGRTTVCVLVHAAGRPEAALRDALAESMRRHVLVGPFEDTTESGDPSPDRTVLIGAAGPGPWAVLLDSQGDERELARSLSATLDTATVFAFLLDSDIVHFRLYQRGEQIDDYCNEPEHYDDYAGDSISDWGEHSKAELKRLTRGEPAKWTHLLAPGTDPAALRRSWDSEPVFADDIFWATVKALGADPDQILRVADEGRGTRLTFRLSEPRLYEQKAEGPPWLELAHYPSEPEVYVGQTPELTLGVQNNGGAATGLDVIAWGSALDNGLLRLAHASVRGPFDIQAAQSAEAGQSSEFVSGTGELGGQAVTVHGAQFDAFEVPQGIAAGTQAQWQPGVSWRRAFMALHQTQFVVTVRAVVEKAGRGELVVACVPHANREEGYGAVRIALRAVAMPRQPLRYRESPRPEFARTLAQLEHGEHLVALLAFAGGPAEAAPGVARTLEAWAVEAARGRGRAFRAGVRTDFKLMPKRSPIAAAQIPHGPRWQAIRQAIPGCLSLSLERGGWRAAYVPRSLYFAGRAEPEAPQLVLSVGLKALKGDDPARVEQLLATWIDELMQEGALLQALVGRWTWPAHASAYATPYEMASGVHGQCTSARFWCTRFLRGVTEQIWLGPELVQQLGGTDALGAVAEVAARGPGVRVTLREDASLDDLEVALAPLLPGERDWHEGVARLHPRIRDAGAAPPEN